MKFNRKIVIPAMVAVAVLAAGGILIHAAVHSANKDKPVNVLTNSRVSAVSSKTEKAAEPDAQVSILAAGDNIIHNCVYNDAHQYAGGKGYQFTQMYSPVESMVKKADIAIVNQETLLGGTEMGLSSYPCFNSPQEVGQALVDIGFDVIGSANNHSMDKGFKGIAKTCEFWKKESGIVMAGLYENADDYNKIAYFNKNGVRFAFIAGTAVSNGIPKPKGKSFCVEDNLNDILEKTTQAKKNAEVVIVYMHWGVEYTNKPIASQTQFAQKLADSGADIIIGSHPHVIEDMAWLTSKDGRKVLTSYSLGNFISAQNQFQTMVGGIESFNIKRQNGKISIEQAKFTPVVTYFRPGFSNFKVYPLSDYTNSLASTHGLRARGIDMSPEHIEKYVKSVISSEFYN